MLGLEYVNTDEGLPEHALTTIHLKKNTLETLPSETGGLHGS